MDRTAVIRGWTELGLHTVHLPSGAIVRVRLPSLDHLLRKQAFPHELEAMVLKLAMGPFRLAELKPEEVTDFARVKDEMVVYCVRERLVAGSGDRDDPANEWADVDLRPFVLELETVLPAEDIDKLGLIALRFVTPGAVTAEVRLQRDLMAKLEQRKREEADPAPREEADPSAADFRGPGDGPDGAGARADGGAVREEPGAGLHAAGGSRDRAPGRPGARATARDS